MAISSTRDRQLGEASQEVKDGPPDSGTRLLAVTYTSKDVEQPGRLDSLFERQEPMAQQRRSLRNLKM
jgi:hypothetical protein